MEFHFDIERHIGPPIEVSDEMIQEYQEKGQFGTLLFDLYREAVGLLTLTSAASIRYPGDAIKFERNQAICIGLLVRTSKLMGSVVKLSSGIEHGETIQALNRCIFESIVNVRYLLLKDSNYVYDRFVKNGLRAERELYDFVQKNIHSRGDTQLVIEAGMLKSILDKCELSGISIDDINPKAGSWGGSFENRVRALGFDRSAYTIMQMIPSHAIHGTWVDLLNNHLLGDEDGFEPNFDHTQTEGELLALVAVLATEAAVEYLDRYFDRHLAEPLCQRLKSIKERIMKVEMSREDWLDAD